jgi:hypothetical protein
VEYVICIKLDGMKKVIVVKVNNLKIHEGKRMCKEDEVPHPYFGERVMFI